jgi:sporulation protein YlmC with PRC-barrel domain
LPPPVATDDPIARELAAAERERADPALRSAREVVGYHVVARDGDVGQVVDLLVDDATWTIRNLVVDTGNWLPGKKVLIGPDRLRSVDWSGRFIELDLSRADVESGPEYEPGASARA